MNNPCTVCACGKALIPTAKGITLCMHCDRPCRLGSQCLDCIRLMHGHGGAART